MVIHSFRTFKAELVRLPAVIPLNATRWRACVCVCVGCRSNNPIECARAPNANRCTQCTALRVHSLCVLFCRAKPACELDRIAVSVSRKCETRTCARARRRRRRRGKVGDTRNGTREHTAAGTLAARLTVANALTKLTADWRTPFASGFPTLAGWHFHGAVGTRASTSTSDARKHETLVFAWRSVFRRGGKTNGVHNKCADAWGPQHLLEGNGGTVRIWRHACVLPNERERWGIFAVCIIRSGILIMHPEKCAHDANKLHAHL